MNKRIQQLVGQAGFHPNLNWDHTDWHAAGHSNLFEKFAELIVKECAELSVNSQYVNTKSEYYEGFNEASIYVGNKIKKHFGIEE